MSHVVFPAIRDERDHQVQRGSQAHRERQEDRVPRAVHQSSAKKLRFRHAIRVRPVRRVVQGQMDSQEHPEDPVLLADREIMVSQGFLGQPAPPVCQALLELMERRENRVGQQQARHLRLANPDRQENRVHKDCRAMMVRQAETVNRGKRVRQGLQEQLGHKVHLDSRVRLDCKDSLEHRESEEFAQNIVHWMGAYFLRMEQDVVVDKLNWV